MRMSSVKRSSRAFDRCAVVRPVSPEPSSPSSSTTTDLPSFMSRYAVVSPAIPPPTTTTSVSTSPESGLKLSTSADFIQLDSVRPESLSIQSPPSLPRSNLGVQRPYQASRSWPGAPGSAVPPLSKVRGSVSVRRAFVEGANIGLELGGDRRRVVRGGVAARLAEGDGDGAGRDELLAAQLRLVEPQ